MTDIFPWETPDGAGTPAPPGPAAGTAVLTEPMPWAADPEPAPETSRLAEARAVMAEAEAAAGVGTVTPDEEGPKPLTKAELFTAHQAYDAIKAAAGLRATAIRDEIERQAKDEFDSEGIKPSWSIGKSRISGAVTGGKVDVIDDEQFREYVATHYPSEIAPAPVPTVVLDDEAEQKVIEALTARLGEPFTPQQLAATVMDALTPEPGIGPVYPAFLKILLDRIVPEETPEGSGDFEALDTQTGEFVPGVAIDPGGKWKNISITPDKVAKERAVAKAGEVLDQPGMGLPNVPVLLALGKGSGEPA